MSLTDLPSDISDAAAAAAGNWRHFESFGWHTRPDDADKWMIVNTTSRDADTATQSNHAAFTSALAPFMGSDVESHSANHWACGWVEGFEVRVFSADGSVTEAFKVLHGLAMALAEYPLLDESDHSQREYDAAMETIEGVCGGYVRARAPKDWSSRVFGHMFSAGNDMSSDGMREKDILTAMATLKLFDRDGRARYRQIVG